MLFSQSTCSDRGVLSGPSLEFILVIFLKYLEHGLDSWKRNDIFETGRTRFKGYTALFKGHLKNARKMNSKGGKCIMAHKQWHPQMIIVCLLTKTQAC